MSKEAFKEKLLQKIYRLFNIRQRSEKEIRDYLKFKRKLKISQKIIDDLIEILKSQGLINDLEFTKAWIESRSKKYGVNRIKQELFRKGIDREIIEEVTSGQRAHEGEGYSNEVAQKLLEKKIERWKNLKPMEFRKKAYEFLLRRGFEYEVVKSVVEKIFKKE